VRMPRRSTAGSAASLRLLSRPKKSDLPRRLDADLVGLGRGGGSARGDSGRCTGSGRVGESPNLRVERRALNPVLRANLLDIQHGTRRSRLLASAISTSRCRRASRRKSRQPMSPAGSVVPPCADLYARARRVGPRDGRGGPVVARLQRAARDQSEHQARQCGTMRPHVNPPMPRRSGRGQQLPRVRAGDRADRDRHEGASCRTGGPWCSL